MQYSIHTHTHQPFKKNEVIWNMLENKKQDIKHFSIQYFNMPDFVLDTKNTIVKAG